MKRVFGEDYLASISIQANDDKLLASAETEVMELLRRQHKIAPNKAPDFHVRNQAEFMETLEEVEPNLHQHDFRDCCRLLACWWHRHHEHYVGLGYGADERDWAT